MYVLLYIFLHGYSIVSFASNVSVDGTAEVCDNEGSEGSGHQWQGRPSWAWLD